MKTFSAKIYKTGINPCVDVPKLVSKALGEKGYIPVKGKSYRFYINGQMRNEKFGMVI